MARTKIEWTECSWNPVTGCTKISAGCEHCYAWALEIKSQAERLSIPFFFKQWGGVFKKRRGRLLEGREWNGKPVELIRS